MCKELHEHLRNIALDLARHHAYSGVKFDYETDRELMAKFKRIERLCNHVGNRSLRDARLELCVDIAELSLTYNNMDFRDQAARSEVYSKLTDALDLLCDMDLVRDEIHAEADR